MEMSRERSPGARPLEDPIDISVGESEEVVGSDDEVEQDCRLLRNSWIDAITLAAEGRFEADDQHHWMKFQCWSLILWYSERDGLRP